MGVTVRREHAKAPAAVQGPAATSSCSSTTGARHDSLKVLGEEAKLVAWREHVRF